MKEFKLAVADLDKALELNDEDGEAYTLRAYCHYRLKQRDKAAADAEKAMQLSPDLPGIDDGDEFMNKADELEKRGEWGEVAALASAELSKAETDDPGVVHYIRGRAYFKRGDYKPAVADLTRAMELNSDIDMECLLYRGMAYFQQGEHDAAIADLSRGELDGDTDAVYVRGCAYHEKGEHDLAIADLTRAIESQPGVAEAHYHRGASYMMKEDHARALADLNKAVELAPGNAMMHVMRACVYDEQGDETKALADVKHALRLDPGNEEARFTLGAILKKSQGLKPALTMTHGGGTMELFSINLNEGAQATTGGGGDSFTRDLAKLHDAEDWRGIVALATDALPEVEAEADKALLFRIRGDAHLKQDDTESAIADFTRALELKPGKGASAYVLRGLAYFQQRDYDSAIADLTREEIADDINAVYIRARAYHEKEQHDLAVADFSKVIESEPGLSEAYYHRGAAYTEKGDYARAVADLNKALELSPHNAMSYILRGYALSMQGKHRIGLADLNQALRLDPDNTEAREVRRLIRRRAKGRM